MLDWKQRLSGVKIDERKEVKKDEQTDKHSEPNECAECQGTGLIEQNSETAVERYTPCPRCN